MSGNMRLLVLYGMLLPLGLSAVACVQGGATILPATDSAAFLDQVSRQPAVSQAQAVQGIRLLLGQTDETTFAKALNQLHEQNVRWDVWLISASAQATRGQLAYMAYQVWRTTGAPDKPLPGLTLALFGPSQRYCLRELAYYGYMADGPGCDAVTGMEFVAVLARLDELRQKGKVKAVLAPMEGRQ